MGCHPTVIIQTRRNMGTKEYEIDGLVCYDNADLLVTHPNFYLQHRIKSEKRKIVDKFKICPNDYRYAHEWGSKSDSGKRWVISTHTNKRAHLFLSKAWVDANFYSSTPAQLPHVISPVNTPTTNVRSDEPKSDTSKLAPIFTKLPPISTARPLTPESSTPCIMAVDCCNENSSNGAMVMVQSNAPPTTAKKVDRVYELAPPLLELEDHEKFRDADGNICDIETRGNRDKDGIYFRVSNVSECFGIDQLNIVITKPNSGYVRERDYKSFIIDGLTKGESVHNRMKLHLFLTYSGLLRVLMVSRNKHVQQFQHWAEKSLFTMQMGTKEDRVELGAKIVNVPVKNMVAMLNTSATAIPVIYLCLLGTVKELRDTFQIPETYDDSLKVYKFGFTNNYAERLVQLQTQYGKLTNVTVTPIVFNYIDPKFTSEAEGNLRGFFKVFQKSLVTPENKYRELIALNDLEIKEVKTQYSLIGGRYAGATAELQRRVAEQENQIMVTALRHQLDLAEKDRIIVEKQTRVNELTVSQKNLLEKSAMERELYELKLQLAKASKSQ